MRQPFVNQGVIKETPQKNLPMKVTITIVLSLFLSICIAQNYEIYVSDAGNFSSPPWQILKFDASGNNPSVFINSDLNWPQDILFMDSINTVLISNLGSGRIIRHNAMTGARISDFATAISGPTRMKVGPDGLLYVLQWGGNGKVKRYKLNGTFVGDFTSVGVNKSIGLDWDAAGNLYVSSYGDDMVRKFDTAGVDQGVFISSNLVGPTNIWFDSNGDLLVSDYDGTGVKRFDSTGAFKGVFLSGLSKSEGVAYLPNGQILIGNGGNSSVKLFSASGSYISDFISSGSGNLKNPNAIVVRPTGPISMEEYHFGDDPLITSISGNEFRLNTHALTLATSITVFDSAGRPVDTITSENWQPQGLSNGVYLVVFTFNDRSRRAAKVVVSR